MIYIHWLTIHFVLTNQTAFYFVFSKSLRIFYRHILFVLTNWKKTSKSLEDTSMEEKDNFSSCFKLAGINIWSRGASSIILLVNWHLWTSLFWKNNIIKYTNIDTTQNLIFGIFRIFIKYLAEIVTWLSLLRGDLGLFRQSSSCLWMFTWPNCQYSVRWFPVT